MAMSFTPDQQKVIDLHDRNILVSAAAGSGKTAVLVERIIQMILNEEKKVDIDRLLVVTFTSAAAAEMRERISNAISKKLEEVPENEHLQKQAALLHNALITTIDSFCLFIIRNNFNDIGLDPGFRVADEGELKLLKQDIINELFEDAYLKKEQYFLDAIEFFTGGSKDEVFMEHILRLYHFAMSHPFPEEWLEERRADYTISDVTEFENLDWCKFLVTYIRIQLKEAVSKLNYAKRLTEQTAGPYFYGELFEQEIEMIEKLAAYESYNQLYEKMETISFGRLPGKKDDSVDLNLRELAKNLRDEVKKDINKLTEKYFILSPEAVAERMKQIQPAAEVLIDLTLEFKKRFDAAKRDKNIIDFSDMEHLALEILLRKKEDGTYEATPAAREYRQYFHEILIDEYQDSNLVQELLLKSISGEDEGRFNRFMVGDVKQSIYKFRLARPELFIEKYTCYSKVDSDRQRIDLHKNFRSRPEVLESVNDLFYQLMDASLGGVTYDEDAALYPGAEYPQYDKNQTEVLLLGKDTDSELSSREQEAALIARKIKELLRDFQVTDKESKQLRPVRYSDIVILLRSAAGWADEFKSIFEKEGIPASVESKTGYFKAVEVKELLLLLRVLDNPLQDIPLFGVMKSYFGGFSEEEIAIIKSTGTRKAYLYQNLQEFCANAEQENQGKANQGQANQGQASMVQPGGPLAEKVAFFLRNLEHLRDMAAYTPIHQLLQEVLTRTSYLEYVSAKPGGEQRRANVEMLLTKAAAFEQTSYYGLFHFLRYIESLEKYEVDYGEADILDENANVVRIMTIHKSKGLEFPICFVAGLAKKMNSRDTSGQLVLDVDMGLGLGYVDKNRRIKADTLRKVAIGQKLKLDGLGEELRVLYVAMTRAREKLFLTAVVDDIEKQQYLYQQKRELFAYMQGNTPGTTPAISAGAQPGTTAGKRTVIPFSALVGAVSYLDFILPCLSEVNFLTPEENFFKNVEEIMQVDALRGELALSKPDKKIVTELSEKMNRTYPYQYLEKLYVKTTVSELKKKQGGHLSEESISENAGSKSGSIFGEEAFTLKMFEEQEIVPYIPSFIEQKEEISGTDRGSAYHKVMEVLDFAKFADLSDKQAGKATREVYAGEYTSQLEEMERTGRITEVQKSAVNTNKVLAFLQTGLAARMATAAADGKLFKEQPFVLGISADRVDENLPKEEMVLVQGIIDVYFEEGDQIVVADYKTDRVDIPEELIDRYKVQLDYYAEALTRLTGKAVKEKIIYSFALNKEIKL